MDIGSDTLTRGGLWLFTLEEVAELLALRTEPGRKQSMRRALSRSVNGCRGAAPSRECPIPEALDELDEEDRA